MDALAMPDHSRTEGFRGWLMTGNNGVICSPVSHTHTEHVFMCEQCMRVLTWIDAHTPGERCTCKGVQGRPYPGTAQWMPPRHGAPLLGCPLSRADGRSQEKVCMLYSTWLHVTLLES